MHYTLLFTPWLLALDLKTNIVLHPPTPQYQAKSLSRRNVILLHNMHTLLFTLFFKYASARPLALIGDLKLPLNSTVWS